MQLAPEPILRAALFTLHWGLIYIRNATCQPDAESAKYANELAEALHEIPNFLGDWRPHSLEELRQHLGCFDHTRHGGSPNLVAVFESQLGEGKE